MKRLEQPFADKNKHIGKAKYCVPKPTCLNYVSVYVAVCKELTYNE